LSRAAAISIKESSTYNSKASQCWSKSTDCQLVGGMSALGQ